MKKIWGVAALLFAISGCAGARRGAPGAAQSSGAASEAGSDAVMRQLAQARGGYRLAPDDLVSVSVYQDKNLGVKTRVAADGTISVPLAGEVAVAGATAAEAQKRVAQALDRYLVKPQVTLVVESYGTKQLFVLGEVQRPGPYPIPLGARLTVLQAVTDAGGFTKAAAPRRTHVLRYADGKSQDYKIDLKTLIRSGDRGSDLVLEPNDVVYVPQTLF